MKPKKATVTPIAAPSAPLPKRPAALPSPLIAGLFAEAGVLLRPGRADIISGSLGIAVAKFRTVAHKLAFEREPGLFPVVAVTAAKKKGGRK